MAVGRHLSGRMFLVVCLSLCLSGCWDYQRIDTRARVIGIGIDPGARAAPFATIRVTFQVPVLGASGSAGSVGPSSGASSTEVHRNVERTGFSLAEIIKQAQVEIDKNLDLTDMRAVIISDRLSVARFHAVLDDLMRDNQIDKLCWVVMSDDSAAGILHVTTKGGAAAEVIGNALDESIKQHGYSHRMRLWELWRSFQQIGVSACVPTIRRISEPGSGHEILQLGGIEVFRGLQPVLRLDRQETLDVNLLMGAVSHMALDIPEGHAVLSFNNVQAHSALDCTLRDGIPRLRARIRVRAMLSGFPAAARRHREVDDLQRIKRLTERYLRSRVVHTLARLQAAGTDVPGFGRRYLMDHPEAEKRVSLYWPALFRRAVADVRVQFSIETRGTLI